MSRSDNCRSVRIDVIHTTQSPAQVQTTEYDAHGLATQGTDPLGHLFHHQHSDNENRTYATANRLSQMTQGTLIWTFACDGAGNRTSLPHPNGTSTDYAYLNNHWLQSVTDRAPGGATFQSTSYSYDQNGNLLTTSSGQTFSWDVFNRMTQATGPGGTVTHVYG